MRLYGIAAHNIYKTLTSVALALITLESNFEIFTAVALALFLLQKKLKVALALTPLKCVKK